MIRRWRPPDYFKPKFVGFDGDPRSAPWWLDGHPWIADCRAVDILNTILGLIRNAPPNMVAISLRPDCYRNASDLALLERTARRRGTRIIWLTPGRAVLGDNPFPTIAGRHV